MKKHRAYLPTGLCLLLIILTLGIVTFSGNVFALSPYEIEAHEALTPEGVKIYWNTSEPAGFARVFWTLGSESPRSLDPFPLYRSYLADNKKLATQHQFVLTYEGNLKRRVLPVTLGDEVHYRVACTVNKDNAFRQLSSRNYSFRVIEDEQGKRVFGLVFTHPPQVANIFKDKATVSWSTNLPARVKLVYWEEGARQRITVEGEEPLKSAGVLLEGLRPARRYYYTVECANEELGDRIVSPTYDFSSAPHGRKKFNFAVMGDTRADHRHLHPDYALNGVNVHVANRLAQLAWQHEAQLILHTGDVINGYTTDYDDIYLQYETWNQAIAPINASLPFYYAMGNHDTSAPWIDRSKTSEYIPAEEIWQRFFILPENGPAAQEGMPPYTENVYSLDYGNCHFVCLNSDYAYFKDLKDEEEFGRTVDELQLEWLEMDLKEHRTQDFIFVYFHEPPYPCGGHRGSSLDRKPEMRDQLWQILDRYNVDAVFCGHEHHYSRLLVDKDVNPHWQQNIFQIIAGGGGAPWYPQDFEVPYADKVIKYSTDYHVILAEVRGRHINFKVYDYYDRVIDEFTLHRKKR